ncbi:MAG: hypothetical protein M1819_004368 [Sarea resinae]|nr:MAG: hypothetical protein M1819_004368 [Sarea resinae]
MVLGILTSIAACPAIIGTTEAVRQGTKQNAKERHRGRKTNLIVECDSTLPHSGEINGSLIVLSNNKLYIAPRTASTTDETSIPDAHPFAGYYLPYPGEDFRKRGEGLVSTISDDPPQLNWIYLDEYSFELKYGNKAESQDQTVGPFDCTMVDKRLTLDGWEGFYAVKESKEDGGKWALYFDYFNDGLNEVVEGKEMLPIELVRRERRVEKADENIPSEFAD